MSRKVAIPVTINGTKGSFFFAQDAVVPNATRQMDESYSGIFLLHLSVARLGLGFDHHKLSLANSGATTI